ncbi:glycosyl transferase family A [Devosia sp. Leaf420]|uniref:glycosyltransferase family 2 protein n=1 Tax=Devosia sp. Leaf420 TaxID=1736374 RepID=UPI00071585CD|nr:glycosyltransferase family 2 protein [Devosia sp. Leaf420]KQT48586.1 glycosyl transferase family A [Devosia sp. Leaf420]
MAGPIRAVVCIPTFRRPDWLERTLRSVLAQETTFGFAVVIVDNDAGTAEGAARARSIMAESALDHLVLVEPNQGNCHAINRAFGEAQAAFAGAEYFLMIDDDEEAMPGWLASIVALANRETADIVGGPVVRRFDVPVSPAVAQHPLFFSIDGTTRQVDQIHGSGNCLIRRGVFEAMDKPPFDVRFNFLGGGDMEFFTRCKLRGFKTWWCEEAVIVEYVPADRVTAKFLTRRSIRTGSINYVVDRTHMPAGKAWAKNIGSLGLGVLRGVKALAGTRSLLGASHPLLLPIGRIMAGLGILPAPYKAKR